MNPSGRSRRRGYLLVSVALMLVVVAAVVLLLTNAGASGNASARAVATGDRVRLVANAGLERARWASRAAGCAASLGMASAAFDGVSLSATQTGGATATTYTLAPSADAWIEKSGLNLNHGSDSELLLRDGAGQEEIGLLRFDLSSLPSGAHVVEATLTLHATSGDPAGVIELREVASSWTEGAVTWTQINAAVGTGAAGVLPPLALSGAELRVNLSELAQAWANVPASNFGVALVARSTSGQRTRVATREAASLLRPQLRVVVVSGAITPAQVQSVGTLGLGVQRTLTASGVTLEQAGAELILQTPGATEDVYLDASQSTSNFGNANTLRVSRVSGDQVALLRFDLRGLPSGATILEARLGLYLQSSSSLAGGVISAHRAIRGWTEAGATHAKYDGSMPWTTPGGDYEPRAVAELTFTAATPGFYEWDVTPLARDWHAAGGGGGVLLRGASTAVNDAMFTSSEGTDATRHPYLRLTLSCACGAACNVPRRTGSLLLVIGDTSALTSGDTAARAALEAWGYTTNLLSDQAAASAFTSGAAANDAIYVAASADPAALAGKLGGLAKGIVSEEPGIAAELGLATSFGSSAAASVIVSDTAHEITRAFAALPLAIHEQPRLLTTLSGTLASGLSSLASVSGAPSLAALENGAARTGGGGAAGRRVMLPIGASSTANWTRLAAGGKTVVQRAVEWAMKTPPPPAKLPIAHWKLDETSGLIAADSVGGHDGSLTGAVAWTSSGQIDGALRFAGTAGTATVPDDKALNPAAALTISTWAYLDRSSSTGTYEIVSKRGLPGNTGYGLWWYNGDLRFAGGSLIVSAGLSLTPRVWQHVAVTFDDAANQVAFFVDGVERKRLTFSGSIPSTTASFYIGAQPYYGSYWNGLLDDVRLYDTALSSAEIAALAAPGGGGSPGKPPDPVCEATFADDFQTNGYGGNSGTHKWDGDWSEINDDGSPSGDDERVETVGSTLAVRVRDNDGGGEGIERAFRPPPGVSSAKLSFGSWRTGLDDASDYVAVQLSADGKPWVEIARIAGPGNDSTSAPALGSEVDVASQLGAVTRIRFLGSPGLGGADILYFDNVTVRLAVPCP